MVFPESVWQRQCATEVGKTMVVNVETDLLGTSAVQYLLFHHSPPLPTSHFAVAKLAWHSGNLCAGSNDACQWHVTLACATESGDDLMTKKIGHPETLVRNDGTVPGMSVGRKHLLP
jgi:hypothetical protein